MFRTRASPSFAARSYACIAVRIRIAIRIVARLSTARFVGAEAEINDGRRDRGNQHPVDRIRQKAAAWLPVADWRTAVDRNREALAAVCAVCTVVAAASVVCFQDQRNVFRCDPSKKRKSKRQRVSQR